MDSEIGYMAWQTWYILVFNHQACKPVVKLSKFFETQLPLKQPANFADGVDQGHHFCGVIIIRF